MRNLWNESESANMDSLDQLVYQSRLIGADTSLVVWGGGNTSIKMTETDHLGRDVPAMLIKGSGSDMKSIERRHFPALRLDEVLPLFDREQMSDDEMVAYLAKCMMDPTEPRPSIETLLHAFLPYTSVAHSHADAVVALTNNSNVSQALDEVYGDSLAIVEYIRPGFTLSKRVGQAVRGNPRIKGVVLVNHGLFTWGDTAKEAYDIHIDLVTQAEDYTRTKAAGKQVFGVLKQRPLDTERRREVAAAVAPTLRGAVSRNNKAVLRFDDAPEVLEFVGSDRAKNLSGIGPATPDHLIQTKRRPLWVDAPDSEDVSAIRRAISAGVEEYAQEYSRWYEGHTDGGHPMLDPYPRVALVPGVGMWSTGRDSRAALVTGDIYHHTIAVMGSGQSAGDYTSLTSQDAFDAEYWPMELYKLTLAPPEKELARRVALVTGGAHGIGKAIAQRLAAEGAHVVVTDLDGEGAQAVAEDLNATNGAGRAVGCRLDVTSEAETAEAFKLARLTFGGLDILVSNAGIATVGAVDVLSLADWQRAFDINTTGHFLAAREAVKLMKEQAIGGSLVFIGTKNVPSPGKDFGAYSASKAAEVQLARVLALENGDYGIRSNIVNPDAIFQGSNLWSEEVKQQRSQSYNIGADDLPDYYRQRNLLKEFIYSEDVAEAVLFLAGDRSSKTTGAMVPVDGGLKDAFPR